jgi:hypothetical protein
VPVDTEKLLKDKIIVAWAAWFVSPECELLRFNSCDHSRDDLPEDGFLCARTRFADGTGENIQTNGWIVFQVTKHGIIFQATGETTPPDSLRYPHAKFIRSKLCPSNLLHIANEEQAQWQ